MFKTAKRLGLIAIALVIASCGGGGGDTSTLSGTETTETPLQTPSITETSINGVLNADADTMSNLLNGGEYVFVVAYTIDESGNPVRTDIARVDTNGNFTLRVPANKPFAIVLNDDVNDYTTAIKDASGKITTFLTNTDTANLTLNVNPDLSISYSGLNETPDLNAISKLNEDINNNNIPDINDWEIIASKTGAEVVIKDVSFNHKYEIATNILNDPRSANSGFIRYHYLMPNGNPFIGALPTHLDPGTNLTCNATYTDYKRFTGDIGIFLVKEMIDDNGNFTTTYETDLDELESTIKEAIADWNDVFVKNNIPVKLYYGGKVFKRQGEPSDCETQDTSDDVSPDVQCYTYADATDEGRYNGVINRKFRGITVQWASKIDGGWAGIQYYYWPYPYKYLDTKNWTLDKLSKDEFAVMTIDKQGYYTDDRYLYNYYKIRAGITIAGGYTTRLLVMEHEIGHALGLMHPFEYDRLGIMKGKYSIMNYAGNIDYPESSTISDFDAQVLKEIYDDSDAYTVLHTVQDIIDFYNNYCNLEAELNSYNISIVRISY
jgi:hypothetical protein